MTIRELYDKLSYMVDLGAGELQVIIGKDAPSPLSDLGYGYYMPETTWCGELVTQEDKDEWETVEDVLVLYPVN